MRELTAEWIAKAEGDWSTAQREWRARKDRNFDGICFHAQQCVEKYLKARMVEANREPPRIHDLVPLLDGVIDLEANWEFSRTDLSDLSEYAVKYRYPGDSATRDEAASVMRILRRIRKEARAAFGLSGD